MQRIAAVVALAHVMQSRGLYGADTDNPPELSLSGSQLHIQMEVNYEGLQMPSDESLTLTPFLLAGEQSFDLPSILINGAEKQKVYERTRVLGGASDTRNGRNSTPSVVLKNDRKASRVSTV